MTFPNASLLTTPLAWVRSPRLLPHLITYLLAAITLMLLVVTRHEARQLRRTADEAQKQLIATKTAIVSLEEMAKRLPSDLASPATPRRLPFTSTELVADATLPRDVFLRIESSGGKPVDITRKEASTILKAVLGTTAEPAQDRFLVQEVEARGRKMTLLVDKQFGGVWRLADNRFKVVQLDQRPTAAELNTAGGEAVDLVIDRMSGRVLRPKRTTNLDAGANPTPIVSNNMQ